MDFVFILLSCGGANIAQKIFIVLAKYTIIMYNYFI